VVAVAVVVVIISQLLGRRDEMNLMRILIMSLKKEKMWMKAALTVTTELPQSIYVISY
jgi:hypothetical protein